MLQRYPNIHASAKKVRFKSCCTNVAWDVGNKAFRDAQELWYHAYHVLLGNPSDRCVSSGALFVRSMACCFHVLAAVGVCRVLLFEKVHLLPGWDNVRPLHIGICLWDCFSLVHPHAIVLTWCEFWRETTPLGAETSAEQRATA